MATTSVHFPEDLLDRLDRLAAARGTSRNRLIVEACRAELARERAAWPAGYLEGAHVDPDDLRLLAEGASGFIDDLRQARSSRGEAPF